MKSIVAACILALVAASGADAAHSSLRALQTPAVGTTSVVVNGMPVAVNAIPGAVATVPLGAQDSTDPLHGDYPPLTADPWSDANVAAVEQAVNKPNAIPPAAPMLMELEAGVDAEAEAEAETEVDAEAEAGVDAEAEAEGMTTAQAKCGVYAGSKVFKIKGNQGVTYTVVYINKGHMSEPAKYGLPPTSTDNSLLYDTACAFDALYSAAQKAGVRLTINSGFRTLSRQQYLWNCYRSKKCNNGNLAATPGNSNHGIGRAVDINVNAPGAYAWLAKNAHLYGFVRTVPTEKWHWENRPGWKKTPYT